MKVGTHTVGWDREAPDRVSTICLLPQEQYSIQFSIHDVDGKFVSDHRLIEADIRLKFGIQKDQPILVEPPGRIFDSMHKYDLRRMGQFQSPIWNHSGELHERLKQIVAGDRRPSKTELNELWSTTEVSMHHLADYSRKEQKKLGVYKATLRHQDPQARRLEMVMERWRSAAIWVMKATVKQLAEHRIHLYKAVHIPCKAQKRWADTWSSLGTNITLKELRLPRRPRRYQPT